MILLLYPYISALGATTGDTIVIEYTTNLLAGQFLLYYMDCLVRLGSCFFLVVHHSRTNFFHLRRLMRVASNGP